MNVESVSKSAMLLRVLHSYPLSVRYWTSTGPMPFWKLSCCELVAS